MLNVRTYYDIKSNLNHMYNVIFSTISSHLRDKLNVLMLQNPLEMEKRSLTNCQESSMN